METFRNIWSVFESLALEVLNTHHLFLFNSVVVPSLVPDQLLNVGVALVLDDHERLSHPITLADSQLRDAKPARG